MRRIFTSAYSMSLALGSGTRIQRRKPFADHESIAGTTLSSRIAIGAPEFGTPPFGLPIRILHGTKSRDLVAERVVSEPTSPVSDVQTFVPGIVRSDDLTQRSLRLGGIRATACTAQSAHRAAMAHPRDRSWASPTEGPEHHT